MSNIYRIDHHKLIIQLLPLLLRKAAHVAWLSVLVTPWKLLHSSFMIKRNDWRYQLTHTPQVFSLENVLNDSFDSEQRRIYIVDGDYIDAIRFYEPADDRPVRFYEDTPQVRFYEPSAFDLLDVDFVVRIPLALSAAEELRFRALLDFYKLPDKTYTLKYE